MKDFIYSKSFVQVLWALFGFIGAYNYYLKDKYLISLVLLTLGMIYSYQLLSAIVRKEH